jgi:hypothetical protein
MHSDWNTPLSPRPPFTSLVQSQGDYLPTGYGRTIGLEEEVCRSRTWNKSPGHTTTNLNNRPGEYLKEVPGRDIDTYISHTSVFSVWMAMPERIRAPDIDKEIVVSEGDVMVVKAGSTLSSLRELLIESGSQVVEVMDVFTIVLNSPIRRKPLIGGIDVD